MMPMTPIKLHQLPGLRSGSASVRKLADKAKWILLLAGDRIDLGDD